MDHKSRQRRVLWSSQDISISVNQDKTEESIHTSLIADTTAIESIHETNFVRVLYSTTLMPLKLNTQVQVEVINSPTEAQVMLVQPV